MITERQLQNYVTFAKEWTGEESIQWNNFGKLIFKQMLFKLPTIFIFFLPAFYLAKEAEKNREIGLMYLDYHLKTNSLDGFLAKLKDEDKSKATLELTKTFFEPYKPERKKGLKLNDLKDLAKIISDLKKNNS